MAHYLFNCSQRDAPPGTSMRQHATDLLRIRLWGVRDDEPHRDELAAGDAALIYLAAPERTFIARVDIASAVHDWSPSEAGAYPGDALSGISVRDVEEWDPPVPIDAVLARIGPSEKAKADFDIGVVRITPFEYETAIAVQAESSR